MEALAGVGWLGCFPLARFRCGHERSLEADAKPRLSQNVCANRSALTLLACLQLGAIILFLFPPTAVLGAVILTGYLGGAIASYTRIGYYYPVVVPLSTSMIAWLGIWLRDERLRALLPIRFGLFKK